MRIWLISGSSSGVGKSTLAHELTRILPDSIVIKVGHAPSKSEKQPNYFTDVDEAVKFIESRKSVTWNMIVESNRLVGKIKADIVIFLDSRDGNRRYDSSRLKSRADIKLGASSNEHKWAEKLIKANLPVQLRKEVLELLRSQNEFLKENRLGVRTKLWFTKDGLLVFGEGLARLLYAVDMQGSLSAAARTEGISYRHAWGDVKRAEERLECPLLKRSAGGRSGGGAKLTPEARKLLEGYENLKKRIVQESNKWFENTILDLKK